MTDGRPGVPPKAESTPLDETTPVDETPPPAAPPRRKLDREETERRLIAAFDRVWIRDGIQGLGVHAVLKEAGGGKEYMNNNVFGWDSCRHRFPSVRAGIHIVASRLANSDLYRDKDVDELLKTYNPAVSTYATRVKAVMRSIAHSESAIFN